MRILIHPRLVCLWLAGVLPLVAAWAQASEPKTAAPISAGAAPGTSRAEAASKPANLEQVLATVNDEKITKGELFNFLSRYQVPQASQEQVYKEALESLVNSHLLSQYLARQQIAVPPAKVNEAIARIESNLKSNGRGDLQTLLQQSGETMEDVRRTVAWEELVKAKATDAELKRFVANHQDLVNSTLLKASHIYLNVAADATAADKEKIRQQLLAIKQDIADKKTSFAAAANAFSQDPANAEKSGGDIGYFGLRTGIIPEFAEAAFILKPGEISDPVETIHGYHLIEVTDRQPGSPVDFEKFKDQIFQLYQADLRKQILTAERKSAEEKHAIDFQPMPPDLFPLTPAATAASAPAAGAGVTPSAPVSPAPGAKP